MKKVLGIVGSYRKGGVIDLLVSEVLSSAQAQGAQTSKIYLVDKHIEFCTNCRTCTMTPGVEPGKCIHQDDMKGLLAQCLESDVLVLGAPVNFFNLNAITRRFMERLVCLAYWPWGAAGPDVRVRKRGSKAILISSTAMPVFLARFFCGAKRALKIMAKTMGAKPVTSIQVGMISGKQEAVVGERVLRNARRAGQKAITN